MELGIEGQRVVGFGHAQETVTSTQCFTRACRPVMVEAVKLIGKTVVIDACEVLFDQVLLTGRLCKDVLFRELGPCVGEITCVGDVLVKVGFSATLEVPCARPGDLCVVLQAYVAGVKEQPLWRTPGGGFKGLADSSVICLCVKVLRPAILVDGDDRDGTDDSSSGSSSEHSNARKICRCKRCPKPKTTGMILGPVRTVPDAQPGPLPGSFTGPTILFPGVS